MFDMIDQPPTGAELNDMNFAMKRALKAKPARRALAKEKVSDQEKADFAKMDTAAAVESDKKVTDMSDDKAMNEIWNNKGRVAVAETDAKAREGAEGKAKKVR